MKKQLVEEFFKDTGEHQISLIAGIDPNPPAPYPNAIFYIRMKSIDKETNKKSKVKPIWLSLNEMLKLSVLMTIASRFWLERLEKNSWNRRKKIKKFIDTWTRMRDAMDELLEE